MGRSGPRIPLGVQVGAVVILFAAASASLWYTGASVVEREERRASAQGLLDRAGRELEERGRDELARALDPNAFTWTDEEALDRRLGPLAGRIMAGFPGLEGGYLVRLPNGKPRFMPPFPEIGPPAPPGPADAATPAVEDLSNYVETQADAAIRKRTMQLILEVVPPEYAVAIRTAPIRVGTQVVVASWVMTQLEDPLFLDRSIRGYNLAAGLALSGIALSLVLTVNLARTVRRQARERQRLQVDLRRSERLAALGKLLAGVAHEVRNPLAGIRSTVQLWQRGIGPDDESFDGLVAEVDRLERIVSDLLQFSRADAQELAPGDLNAVVAEAAHLARGPADAKEVGVGLDLAPGLPAVAMSAPALVQVFRNLTRNAIQAMPRGGHLHLATRHDPARGLVEAVVADSGPGLSPEALGHLFEPFFTTKAGGTGLGLAIAREIALAHRGDLRAENRPAGPGGAAFTLTLPVAQAVATGPPAVEARRPGHTAP